MPKVIMMKKTLFYFLTIISLASVSNAFGQGRPDYFGIANRAFDNGNYQQASNYYQKLLKEEPDSTISLYPFGMNYRGFGFVTLTEINQISYKLAECYRNLHDYKNAEVWAAKARALNDKDFPLAQFYYAEALQRNGKYLLAIEEYRQFNSQITEFSPRYYDALLGVESSTYAIAQIKNPDSTYIGKLSDEINGQGSVFAASLDESKTELIYTSSAFILTEIEDEEAPKPKKNQEIEKEEVYSTKLFSTMKIGANYTAPSPIDIEVKEGYGIAEASFNRKMTRVYFTMWKGNPTKGDYSIYVANKKDNIWGKPEKLGKNVNAVNSRALMPYYYETENILFFVSDRKGGAGGLDIWYAQVDTFGRPNTPLNLGKEINTAKDDVTPFYDIITGALFFSSNGRVGMGGMDIFKAEGFLDNWKAVNNLGYPINSSKEDLYYAAGADYQSGYFTSDRMDCKDCAGPACLKLYEIKVPPLRYKTTALDAETMEPIEGVVIELMDSSAKFKYQETLSNEKGSVIIEMEPASDYTIKASKKGYLTESLKYSTVNKSKTGTFEDKPILLFKQLVVKGVVVDGESFDPLIDALVVLKDSNGVVLYSDTTDGSGDYFFNLERNQTYQVFVSKDKYLTFNSKLVTDASFDPNNPKTGRIELLEIIIDKPIVIKDIYYDFGKSTLRAESKEPLDSLARLLRINPNLVIEISSHTDNIGRSISNMKLSQERAKSVVDFLIEAGIDPKLLKTKGYGEAMPIAPNQNPDGTDNPENRQLNRRTEFSVVKILRMPAQ